MVTGMVVAFAPIGDQRRVPSDIGPLGSVQQMLYKAILASGGRDGADLHAAADC
jgi:hypothetical protein